MTEVVAQEELCVAAPTPQQLLAALRAGRRGGRGPARLVVTRPTTQRLAQAARIVERGRPVGGRMGILFSPRGHLLDGGKLVFLFPGFGERFEPRLEDLAERLTLRPANTDRGDSLEAWGAAVVEVNRLLAQALARCGIQPDCVAGHSIGDWSALVAGGLLEQQQVDAFRMGLAPGSLDFAEATFIAAGCSASLLQESLQGLPQALLSHDNCPHQVVACARGGDVELLCRRLQERGVAYRKLPFGSGIHTRFFEPCLSQHRANVAQLRFGLPRVPTYSATTCEPYPADAAVAAELSVRHMVEPIRFRELLDRLYGDGGRVFVQVGTGSLVSFVEDTLRGRPHRALASNLPDRAGLAQLRLCLLGLWVEGAEPLFERLETRGPIQQTSQSLAAQAQRNMDAIGAAQTQILQALARVPPAASSTVRPAPERRQPALRTNTRAGRRRTRRLSLETFPELRDHAFFRQPVGWAEVSDLNPVVPMTALLEILAEEAQPLARGQSLVALEDVWAKRFAGVAEPLELPVACSQQRDGIHIALGEHVEGRVVFGQRRVPEPRVDLRSLALRPASMSAEEVYAERWMFHGPAYQSVEELCGFSEAAVVGRLRARAGRGSLLDGVGQLIGLWLLESQADNQLAMPWRIGRLEFFRGLPQGEPVTCEVRIVRCGRGAVHADAFLSDRRGGLLAIQGWQMKRFAGDEAFLRVLRHPEFETLSVPQGSRRVELRDRYDSAATRSFLAGRYLARDDRHRLAQLSGAAARAFLMRRIAAKDLLRTRVWASARRAIFPAQVVVDAQEQGLCARVSGTEPISIEIEEGPSQTGETAYRARLREGGV